MSHVQNLQHAVMAAKAGNPSLARVHLHKAAEEAPDDPAVWLWMGWLSDSPISMVQCLEAAIQDERHRNIAQAGLAFARALCAYQVTPTQAQTTRPVPAQSQVGKQSQVPVARPAGPVELVEQLAADVAAAERDLTTDGDEWRTQPARQSDVASGWDPNGLVPPPLPTDASDSPRQPETTASAPGQAVSSASPAVPSTACGMYGSQETPPPVPGNDHIPPSGYQAVLPPVSQAVPRPAATNATPVWRAASSDWFMVDSRSEVSCSVSSAPAVRPAPAPRTEQAHPQVRANDDAWSQPAAVRSAPAPQPVPVPPTAKEARSQTESASDECSVEFAYDQPSVAASNEPAVNRLSAAEQLDAELERRHVDVAREATAMRSELEPVDEAGGGSPATDFDVAPPVMPSVTMPSTAVPIEPWRPAVVDRTPPSYESPALVPTEPYSNAGLRPTEDPGPAGVEPTFEGEPLKPATHPRTVLVVDDSPTVRKLVTMTLEKNGYRVVSAFDGVAAIREIAEHNPALILMDVNMPRMDGYQLCKLVRKHEVTRHIPVLMLSGKDGVFDRLRGKMVGCSGYVPKPFIPEELVQAVGEHIGVAVR